MRSRIFLLLVLLGGCASQDLTISEDATGTWARIIDRDGRVVVDRIDFGQSRAIDAEGVLTSNNSGQIFLTANGYRKSDNCPLGSVTYEASVQSNGLFTSPSAAAWHIAWFNSSGQTIGFNGECLANR